ncbi:hypothetical protein EPIB1_2593 [Tritonibacter mobilis]|nr:hypothetical protein EPIB1_2593 [Tritonibacter mobilis]
MTGPRMTCIQRGPVRNWGFIHGTANNSPYVIVSGGRMPDIG